MPETKAEIVTTGPNLPTNPFPGESNAITPMELLQMAINQGAALDKLEKLMDLQERWEKNEARKAFVEAMNAFKANPPEILKNKHVKFGQTEYDHATLDHVCKQITESLSKHGISHRWRIEQQDSLVRVTCILTHQMGHSEETTLSGGADTSGSKNAIQAVGSTVTYLERYTLLAATGLAAGTNDTDGVTARPMEGLDQAVKALLDAPDTSALNKMFKDCADKALKAKNGGAIVKLTEARDKRRKELEAA